MTRSLAPELLDHIKAFEGCVLKAYHDPVGYPTIGVGHLLSKVAYEDLSKYPDIDMDEAMDILAEDLAESCEYVENLVNVDLTDAQFGALVSLVFNIGVGNFQSSTLLRLLNQDDYQGAADEFPKWRKSAGKVLAGLERRRAAERKMFLTDVS